MPIWMKRLKSALVGVGVIVVVTLIAVVGQIFEVGGPTRSFTVLAIVLGGVGIVCVVVYNTWLAIMGPIQVVTGPAAGWNAPHGWTYTESDAELLARVRQRGVRLAASGTAWNVLTTDAGSPRAVVFQTAVDRTLITWCLVETGPTPRLMVRRRWWRRTLKVVTTPPPPPDVAESLARLDGWVSYLGTKAGFVVVKLTPVDPAEVTQALAIVPILVDIAEGLQAHAER